MGAWVLSWVDAFGWDDFGDTVVESDRPTVGCGVVSGFDDAVVVWAGEDEILKGGSTSGPPGGEVVGVAGFGWLLTSGEHAPAVAEFEGCPDGWGDQPLGPADVEGFGLAVQHDREDVGVA